MKVTNDFLIIGDTSQISKWLPVKCDRISSREFHSDLIGDYRRIFVCFAEQRTFNNDFDFVGVNYDYTLEVVDSILSKCDEVVWYSTTMLWENLEKYSIDDDFSYDESNQYLVSKEMITNELRKNPNVLIHYPCNFNSSHRKEGYLFSKLMSACRGNKVSTGNLNFNREMTHGSWVGRKSFCSNSSEIIAPGFLTNIRTYFHDVLSYFSFHSQVISENIEELKNKTDSCYTISDSYSYNDLLKDTVLDIRKYFYFMEQLNKTYGKQVTGK